jgi:hypothetical protein
MRTKADETFYQANEAILTGKPGSTSGGRGIYDRRGRSTPWRVGGAEGTYPTCSSTAETACFVCMLAAHGRGRIQSIYFRSVC